MTARKVLLLGATGPTGREVVAQGLERGLELTALVRSPERLRITHERLRIVTGDVTAGPEALTAAMRGQDAVISALGAGKSFKSGGLIARSAPAIVHAMEGAGVRRLVFTSAYGVGVTWRDVPLVPRILMRLFLRDVYADKAAGEEVITGSDLEWTLVYPVTLTNGERTGRRQAGERLALRGLPTISRADLAEFLLSQLDDRAYVRKGVLLRG